MTGYYELREEYASVSVAFYYGVGVLTLIIGLKGRLLGIAAAVGLMAMGIILTFTVVGAPVGIPVAVLGLLVMIRRLF